MKKNHFFIYILACSAALLSLAACSTEDLMTTGRNGEISASFDNADSRVDYTYATYTESGTAKQKLAVKWAAGDKIDIYAGSVSSATKGTFTLSSGAGTQSAKFAGGTLQGTLTSGTTPLYAIVEKSGVTVDETNSAITTSLTSQDGTLANAASKDVLFATSTYNSTANSLTFAHKMAILKLNLNLPESGGCLLYVQNLGTNGSGKLYSSVTLDATTGALKSSSTTGVLYTTTTVSVTAGTAADFYLALYPQTVQNLFISVYFPSTGNQYSYVAQTSSKDLTAGNLYCSSHTFFTASKYMASTKTTPVTLIVTGADFSDAEMASGGTFETKAKACIDYLFTVEPYKTYKEYFNVYIMPAHSKDLGYVNTTASGGTDYTYTLNTTTATTFFRNNCPDFYNSPSTFSNRKMCVAILANTTLYFGLTQINNLGADFAVSPISTETYSWKGNNGTTVTNIGDYRNIFLHEFGGHAFGRLSDEYWYDDTRTYSGTALESEHAWTVPNGKNLVTAAEATGTTGYYWAHMIGTGTGKYPKEGTSYEGGYIYGKGVYRPELISVMGDNRPYFNAYSRQLIVERILSLAGETFSYDTFVSKDVNYDPVAKTMKIFTGKNIIPAKPLSPPQITVLKETDLQGNK